ncbi:DUF86 domain-containing protein [Mycobacterium riyadhense]|uniref:DUF86 domain-containing protein n=1 Tax=Mycobacterium riyadhense TaxID=486698 RepID=A0A653F2N9_9MYCO|nr:HepT-like ribonuclease domain-containing protein [Mycobacterium riyadhense]VTP03242.1 hypothetical protein BIN_B_04942 [Mycobacterium riyadhense]
MTRRRRKDSQHLKDASEHLQVLCEHLARGSLDDALIRDAVSHRLEVAIDAVAKVSPELLDAEAPAEWPKIVAMRNLLAHQYVDLDQEILQNTIDNRLEGFTQLVERLHETADANERPIT